MRTLSRLALPAALVALTVTAARADPEPLLKPITPPGSGTRVRFATSEEKPIFYHVEARIPDPKKKDKGIDVVVAFESLPGKSSVALKKWKGWGFDVPANRVGVLPELVIPGSQLAPKASKVGVEVRLTNVKLEIVDVPGDGDTVLMSDVLLTMSEFTKGADRAFEPRMYFADKFMEFTVPNAAVRRPGTGDDAPPPPPAASADKDLVVFSGPSRSHGGIPVLAFASIDGQAQYKLPDGKLESVNAGISSTMNWQDGVLLTIGTARGCGIAVMPADDLKGLGVGFETTVGRGTLKELRLGFVTGPGGKVQKDLVLTDVPVIIDKNNSGHFVWIGPRFLQRHFTDPVYAFTPEGGWRLHGRVKPELLNDTKTRTPPKKP